MEKEGGIENWVSVHIVKKKLMVAILRSRKSHQKRLGLVEKCIPVHIVIVFLVLQVLANHYNLLYSSTLPLQPRFQSSILQ